MNPRLFFTALLLSFISGITFAGSAISLGKTDFTFAQPAAQNGKIIVRAVLSETGQRKIKQLNKNSVDKEVQMEIAGVSTHFVLKEPIHGLSLEMGPYTSADAQRIVDEINRK